MSQYLKGMYHGLPICIGYLSVSFGFGLLAVKSGLNIWEATLISLTNLTSAGQIAGVGIIAASGTVVEMILTQLIINIRYSLMAISLSQKVSGNFGTLKRIALGMGITDEIYAVSMSKEGKVNPLYFLGLCTLPYIGWSLGTFSGAFSGGVLPAVVTNALGVALYGMFVAIVVPPAKKDRSVLIAVAIAILLSLAFHYLPVLSEVSFGFAIIICAVVASLICAWLFPIKENA